MNFKSFAQYRWVALGALVCLIAVFLWYRSHNASKNKGSTDSTTVSANIDKLYENHEYKALNESIGKLKEKDALEVSKTLLHVVFEFPECKDVVVKCFEKYTVPINPDKALAIYKKSSAEDKENALIDIAFYKWDDAYIIPVSQIVRKSEKWRYDAITVLAQSGSFFAEKKLLTLLNKKDKKLLYEAARGAHNSKNRRLAKRLLSVSKKYKDSSEDYAKCVDRLNQTIKE